MGVTGDIIVRSYTNYYPLLETNLRVGGPISISRANAHMVHMG